MVIVDFASWMQVGWHFDLIMIPVLLAMALIFWALLR